MSAAVANSTAYTELVAKVRDMQPQRIIDMADRYARADKEGEALVLYAVVYGRYNDEMTDNDKNLCAQAHKQAGMIYYNRSNYVSALKEFIDGVIISEQCDRPIHIARLYNNIGNIYCVFLEYEKGIDYYLKAYDFCRKAPDRETEHDILVNLTGMYTFTKDIAKAKQYYRLAEKRKDKNDPLDAFMSGYTLSLIQVNDGMIAEAIAGLKKLAVYAREHKLEPKYECFAYQEIYNAYEMSGQPDSTLKYLQLCDKTARRHNMEHTFANTLKSLSTFYKKEGNMAESGKYWSRYQTIMDSIYNMREFDVVKNSLFTYEVDKTNKEMTDLRAREEEKARTIRIQRVTMGVVVGNMIVLALFLVIVLRQKRRINRSYSDLYMLNRNFIDTQEQLTARLRKENETLKEKNDEIDALKKELGKIKNAVQEQMDEPAKYQTSNLTEAQKQDLAEQIQGIMENTTEYCNCEFSLGTLAELVNSNKKYVSQAINDTFHKSFNDYVNPYRIHLACIRFADTENYGNFTMKAIAESVGFKSYTSFVNIFRKITGITPSIYQKMAAQGGSIQNE